MKKSAENYLPKKLTLANLRKAATNCHGCHLYKYATQTVFGAGNVHAPLMMVGEIPGKVEDETGKPFTGPAGTLLRETIEQAGLDEKNIYFTNVVKHFKYSISNNKKLHRSPDAIEIKACKPWLEAEIAVIKPKVIVCLGLIAAKVFMGSSVKIRDQHGKLFKLTDSISTIITFHPSAILRTIEHAERDRMKKFLLTDLKQAHRFLDDPKRFMLSQQFIGKGNLVMR